MMLSALAITLAVSAAPVESPQCTYYRFLSAGVWSALDDAERAGASRFVTGNLETTLRDTVAKQRRACGQ